MIDSSILPRIKSGAKVKVYEKTGMFTGIVLARKHGNEIGATFTVRSVISGVGVEKVYPINSPLIQKVEILSSPKKVHRSKLYFVRDLSQKRLQEKLGVK